MKEYKSYFRPEIEAMSGYVPGTQPKIAELIKLNTNENPYPPSPKVLEAAAKLDLSRLRRYPDPLADELCSLLAAKFGVSRDMVIVANGSDDVLTWVMRAFSAPDRELAMLDPTYSLYEVLAMMQGAPVRKIRLQDADFALPDDVLEQARGANLFVIPRPNSPTGNSFDLAAMRRIAENFDGVLVIDEAYADFASDNCMDFVREFSNVIICRTMSKSYSLAGLRLGFAVGDARLIAGLYKLKDSYNVDMIAQRLALAAAGDDEYLQSTCRKVLDNRKILAGGLKELKFAIVPSEANFIFAAPPDGDGRGYFEYLHDHAVEVRYFPGRRTGSYVRITVGTPEEIAALLKLTRNYLKGD